MPPLLRYFPSRFHGFAVYTSVHIGFLYPPKTMIYLKDPIYLPQRIGDNYKLSSFLYPKGFFDYIHYNGTLMEVN